MPHHSSSIDKYRRCPRMYRLLKDNPAIATATVATERGTAVHKAAEAMVNILGAGGTRQEAEEKARRVVSNLRGELSGESLEETEYFLDRLTRQPFPEKQEGEVWLAEWPFAFDKDWNLLTLPAKGLPEGTYYFGRVDFIRFDLEAGVVSALDWKSARQVESPKTLFGGFQLPGYIEAAMAEVERRGGEVQVADIIRWYTTKGVLQTYRLTEEDMGGAIRRRIDDEILAIEKDTEFTPRPEAGKCMGCPVKFLCEAYLATGQAAVEPKSVEDAVRLYRQKELAEAQADQAAIFLKAWIKRHGPVPIGPGVALDFKESMKRHVREDAADLLVQTRGFDAATVMGAMNLTVKGLERLLGDEPEDLKPFITTSPESRLSKVEV